MLTVTLYTHVPSQLLSALLSKVQPCESLFSLCLPCFCFFVCDSLFPQAQVLPQPWNLLHEMLDAVEA